MPYRLRTGESVQEGIRRILSEQVERALGELADTHLDRADTIHQARKRCKKIRATLRLVRGALGKAYSRENAWYRDAAQRISDVRDTEAMIETCDALAEYFADPVDRGVIRPVRLRLETRKNTQMEDTGQVDKLLQDFESAMLAGHRRVASLSIEGHGYGPALAGMRGTYSRARSAMQAACDNPAPETFHEWRKQVKYHWYHMRLLREVWPSVAQARRVEAYKLAGLLGNHHDLCVLRAWVLNDPAASERKEDLASFIELVDKWTGQIERQSKRLGHRLFAQKPRQLERRFAIH